MRLSGTLRTWNDDRGFGFIAPTQGGAELFVHISALPRDGTRPTIGEKLSYELGRGKNGQPQAVNVRRDAIGTPRMGSSGHRAPVERKQPLLGRALAVLLLLGVVVFGVDQYRTRTSAALPPQPIAASPEEAAVPPAAVESFKCDGRSHCSQMTSCAEAKYFLNNCPGTKMDGNNDGVPCEQQWCTSPLAK